ncbi:hypothetical protein N5U14_06745 [Aliarcobacter butzleri]|uniref:hypothetical protein n=1 Tax=Aliarcobacter butzleri TaxID=28197 RepID=UPI0021B3B8C0|nr:hypothetical protein [Aliarcobacter butzleri]MCT7610540.1 hypothetical protein [Aliarcobacter butzleri]
MSLFEIELNSDFKILNSNIFFDDKDLKKYYKLNKLNDNYDDNIEEIIEKYKFFIHQDLFVIDNCRYESDKINYIILSNIYKSNANSKEHILHPEWLLFLISIKKKKVKSIDEKEFHKYLEYFKYIAEIRYKKYIIRNVRNYIDFKELEKVSDIKKSLHNSLLKYLKESEYETEELYDYLNFLYKFHQELKDNEKYKLMWNIEVYIKETITLLLDKEITLKEIYEEFYKYMRGTYSVLHEIYIYKPLYIEESKNQFKSYLEIINKIFNSNIDLEKFISILTKNEKYEDILFSCIDLNKRFNANKLNEHLMGTIARSIVLSVEEVIKDYKEERKLLRCLKSLSEDKILFESYIIEGYNSSDELLELLDKLICDNEQSLEQYLAIYLASRNYLAHYNIDMDKFFWGLDGERRIVSNTLNSVIIILFRIEILKEK